MAYRRSGNVRVIKFSCFKFKNMKNKKYFRGPGYLRKFFDGINRFYVPRFSDLERDCAR